MKLKRLDSRNIAGVAYSSYSKFLLVEFTTGRTYLYYNVPEQIYKELLRAPSHGSYHAHNIKGKYAYLELDYAEAAVPQPNLIQQLEKSIERIKKCRKKKTRNSKAN